ncbi:unnamed protein product [Effrenium voratum]|nr:unnamed protein product [Effrenium voratum]
MAGSDSEASINHGGLEKEDPDHYGRGVFTGRPEECAYEGLYRGPVKYLKSFFMASGAHPDDVPAVFVVVHGFGCNVVGNHNTLRNVIKSKMVKSSVMIISPLFDKEMFPGNEDFQSGNVYRRREGGFVLDDSKWTFSVIPNMVKECVPEAKTYVIYGHSAGGQFSHRLCYFEGMMSAGHPEYPRIEKALIANPGWYTMPDTSMYYPYGLDRTPLPDMKALLEEFVRLPKVLLLGTSDTNTEDPDLRKTPEANQQGPHRLARGLMFAEKHKEMEASLGVEDSGFQLVMVEGVGHSNAQMAAMALDHSGFAAPSAPRPSHAPPPAGAAPRAGRSRRALLAGLGLGLGLRRAARAESALSEEQKLQILQEVQSMGDIAVTAPTVQEEEAAWTRMLDRFAGLPDIEVRVRCNRGNSLARQGKLQEALQDYNRAIELVPDAADPHLNRGAVYEALGRLEEALVDYDLVLRQDETDPAAWNNRGNALLGLRRFQEAKESFQQALDISGTQRFAFAGVNMALAQYELKEDDQAITNLRQLLARYAEAFPDARAAYAMILWDQGDRIEAESQWDRATGTDPRYKSAQWVQEFRRWPPRMMEVFKRFADTTGVKVK